jgi:hypothetical protein
MLVGGASTRRSPPAREFGSSLTREKNRPEIVGIAKWSMRQKQSTDLGGVSSKARIKRWGENGWAATKDLKKARCLAVTINTIKKNT